MAIAPLLFSAEDLMLAVLDSQAQDSYFSNPDATGKWWWHASSLAFGCIRRMVLERACRTTGAIPLDPTPLDGRMNMLIGTLWHEAVERGVRYLPTILPGASVEVLHVEEAFYHKDIPLVAKPDGVFRINGRIVVYDIKTEKTNSAKYRAQEARDEGRHTTAKPDHQLQLAAQALCLESNGVGPVEQGMIYYIERNNGWLEAPPVDLSGSIQRLQVKRIVDQAEAAWAAFVQGSKEGRVVLPPRLPGALEAGRDGKPWNCRVQSTQTKHGKYCTVASFCQDRRLPG